MRAFAILLLPLFCACAQEVPDKLRVPDTQKLILHAHGVGDQIYTCKMADAAYAWTLKGPEAQLLDPAGQVLGRHFAGPTWEAKDGSRVLGKAAASVPSHDAASIPWLLVNAVGHEGSGLMTAVVTIQRLETKGGKAPAGGCDADGAGGEVRVPYQAEYYFYGEAAQR
jgi:hypothetical protein